MSTLNPTIISFDELDACFEYILTFSTWGTRRNFALVSRKYSLKTKDDLYWKFFSKLLAVEHDIYVPSAPPRGMRWKECFLELFKLKDMWSTTPQFIDNDKVTKFKVNVFTRFRPHEDKLKESEESDSGNRSESAVTLPLHQRLQLIRISRKISNNR